ncbi:hypothetical protein [Carboxylicivirga sp. RSCT41]|uniref:hypothetical protein n=1 Tax=Carboxylicivirga agarovorans TaxID=3417570 RepID=UPI003D346D11
MRSGLLKDKIIWKKSTKINNKGDVSYTYEERELRVYISRSSGSKGVDNNETFTSNNINFKCRNNYNFSNEDKFIYNDAEYVLNNSLPTVDRIWLDVSISKKNS